MFREKFILVLLFLFCSSAILLAEDINRPEDFNFSNPRTMAGKLTINYYGQMKYFKSDNFKIIPIFFEIINDNKNNKALICFASSADGASSWNARDLHYDEEHQEYEFFAYKFGGAWQKLKLKYENDKINCYVKEGDIWEEEKEWTYVADLVYLLDNYKP